MALKTILLQLVWCWASKMPRLTGLIYFSKLVIFSFAILIPRLQWRKEYISFLLVDSRLWSSGNLDGETYVLITGQWSVMWVQKFLENFFAPLLKDEDHYCLRLNDTMKHNCMKMPWISSENPMKTAKKNFMAVFMAMNFPWKWNHFI